MNLTDILTKAEESFKNGQFEEAVKAYIEAQQLLLEDYKKLNLFINERLKEIVSKLSMAISMAPETGAAISEQVPSEEIAEEAKVELEKEAVSEPAVEEKPVEEPTAKPDEGEVAAEGVASAQEAIEETEEIKPEAIEETVAEAPPEAAAPAPEPTPTPEPETAGEEVQIDDIMKQLDELDKEVSGKAEPAAEPALSEEGEEDISKKAESVENIDIDDLLKDLNI